MPDTLLILVRHGEVPDHWKGRYIGLTDPPLSEAGRDQCRRLAEPFRALEPERIFSSPLLRARQSAAIVAGELPVNVDLRLAEIDFGEWENRTFDEICRIAPREAIAVWAERPEEMAFPGGDTFAGFCHRVDAFTDELLAAAPGRAAVVTHGGVLMRMLCRFRGLPASRQLEVLPRRGSMTCLRFNEGVWTDEI